MKPSNTGFNDPSIKTGTGIDWMDDRGISPEELASAVAACDMEVERFGRDLFSDPSGPFIEYLDLCYIVPAIVRLAIAEYRKEAKAKWQRELSAKAGALPEYNLCDGRAWLAEDVLALLNENDDHAE